MPEDIYGNQISEEEWKTLPPELGGPAAGEQAGMEQPRPGQEQASSEETERIRDVTPPPDARVIERTGSGAPSVAEANGEKYFLPGSTPYEQGHRTESERVKAEQYGTPLGPYEAPGITEPSVVLISDGKPVARWTQKQIEQSRSEEGYAGGNFSNIDEYIKSGQVRYPVKDSEGKEVLLTTKQYKKLTGAETPREQLAVAKDLKLVPRDTTLEEYTRSREEQQAKAGAESFVSQQETKRQTEALAKLAKYKTDEGYELGKAVADGVPARVIESAGFEKSNIEAAKKEADYIKATPREKFNILKQGGLIPKDAVLSGQNPDGSINYVVGPVGEGPIRGPLPVGSAIRFTDVPARLIYKDPETAAGTGHMTSTVARTQFEIQEMGAENQERFDTVVGLVPALGTAYLITKKAPASDIALSAASDALLFVPVGKVFGALRNVISPGSREAAAVQRTIASEVAASRNTLKSVTNKETVKAFDSMTKASKEYAKNLSDIKIAEKTIKNVPESNLAAIAKSDLPKLQAATGELKTKAMQKAYSFSEALGRSGAAGDLPLTQVARESSAQHIRGIEQAVNQIFDDSPKNVKTMAKKLKTWQSDLEMARFDKDVKEINRLSREIPVLKANLKIVYTSEAQRLSSASLANKAKISQLQREIAKLREPTEELIGARSTEGIKEQIKTLQLRQRVLDKEAAEAAKRLEIDWGPPIPRSGGKGGITTKAPPGIGGGGGGIRLAEKPQQELLPLGAKIIYQSADGVIEWTIPMPQQSGPGTFTMAVEAPARPGTTPKRTIPLPKWWPRPTPKPSEPSTEPSPEPMPTTRPSRPGHLPEKQPGEEPTPVIAPRPEPDPGTRPGFNPKPYQPEPVFVPDPITAPAVKVGAVVRSGTQTRRLTKAEAQAIRKTMDKLQTAIKSGMTPAQAIQEVNKTSTGTKISIQQQVQTKVKPQTSTQQTFKTETKVPTKFPPDIKPPNKIPPKIPKGKGTDSENRARILASNGAIAWRMGKVGGKERWDVIVNPYKSNEDYVMILGNRPEGAVIAEGPGSVRKTARMIYGEPPKKPFSVDSGFTDIKVTPTKEKRVTLDFNADPHNLTRGDITIGQERPRISERLTRITNQRGMITSRRQGRISPARPRIGR